MLSLVLKPVFSSKRHNKAMAQDWARLNTLLPQVSMGDLMEPVQFLVDDQAPCLPAATWCGLLGALEERFGYPTPSEQEMSTLYDFLTRMYMSRGWCSLAAATGAHQLINFFLFYGLLRPHMGGVVDCARLLVSLNQVGASIVQGYMRTFPFDAAATLVEIPMGLLNSVLREGYPHLFENIVPVGVDGLGREIRVGDVVYACGALGLVDNIVNMWADVSYLTGDRNTQAIRTGGEDLVRL